MTSTTWDPGQYAKFADERGRPFADLLSRVPATDPGVVLDLGCGDGPLTLSLARRWPHAQIIGVDSSPQMLARAAENDTEGAVDWLEADLRDLDLPGLAGPPDVVISNATLQWLPGHLDLLPRWSRQLSPGGWLAIQVPGNLGAPSHRLMRAVAAEHPRRKELTAALRRPAAAEPDSYLQILHRAGLRADVWETTYLHVLDREGEQDSPVLEWVRSTGLRPVLDVLTAPDERENFLTTYAARLAEAYPRTVAGVIFPFRRIFAVGHRPDG